MEKIIMLLSVMLTTLAQTMWKIGGTSAKIEGDGILPILFAYIKSPLVILGFGLAGVASVLWTYALSKLDFNFVSFVSSVSYIFAIIVSIFIFKETISPMKWAGCGIILVGVIFVMRG
jgi:Predicted membrane protein